MRFSQLMTALGAVALQFGISSGASAAPAVAPTTGSDIHYGQPNNRKTTTSR